MISNSTRATSKRAFTLIELLVVIAIIAILAAILFPVFAAAREKARQTVCISNYKQEALGILQYVQDYDETYPIAEPFLPASDGGPQWDLGWFADTPPTAYPEAYTPGIDNTLWANSIQPYIKSFGTYYCPSTQVWSVANMAAAGFPGTSAQIQAAPPITYTYNGDLQFSTLNQVLAPASVILIWNGLFKTALPGWSWSLPQLTCPTATDPCKYVPPTVQSSVNNGQVTLATCSTANGGNGGTDGDYYFPTPQYSPNLTKWVHGQGDNYALADGHVKWSPFMQDGSEDPYCSQNNAPVPCTYYDGCHDYLFRPDYVP